MAQGAESKARRSRSFRVIRALLVGVVALAALYLVVGNLLLKTSIIRNALSKDPEKLLLEYDSAYTILPGKVHAERLRVRGKDSSVEWELGIGQVDFRLNLFELARKHFHASWVRGADVSFRIRRRLEQKDATKERVALLPPIDGLEVTPIKPPPQPPPTPEDLAKIWTIQLDDVVASNAYEIWVDEYRARGEHTVRGGFHFRPMQEVWIGPATVELTRGSVTLGPSEAILSDVNYGLSATVLPFAPRETHGKELLKKLVVHLALDATMPGLALVRHVMKNDTIDLQGRGGQLRVDMGLKEGAIVDGGSARVEGAHVELAAAGHSFVASLSAHAASDHGLTWDVRAASIEVAPIGHEKTPLKANAATAHGRVEPGDLTKEMKLTTVTVDLPTSEADFRLLNVYEKAIAVDAGKGTFGAKVTIAGDDAHGDAIAGALGATIDVKGNKLSGDVIAAVKAERRNNQIRFDTSHITLRHVRASAQSGPDTPPEWWGDIAIPSATLTLTPALELRASVQSHMRDARPILSLLVANAALPAWASHLTSLEDFQVTANGAVGPYGVDLRNIDTQGSGYRIRATLLMRGPNKLGVVLIEKGPLSVGIEINNDKTSLVSDKAVEWYEARAAQPVAPRAAPRRAQR